MANLTGTQKKKRNQFAALLVAIVVVLAAIFYVVFSAFMAKSAFLENQDFASALSEAYGKAARNVSKEDLAAVKYLEVFNDGQMGVVGFGDSEFAKDYERYLTELDAAEIAKEAGVEDVPEVTPVDTSKLMHAQFDVDDEGLVFDDIEYFTGVENVAFSSITFDAESFKGENIKRANFSDCGLTNEDLATIAKSLNLENVAELTFMGNSIDDWSPLESISDKVTIQSYGLQMTEDGQYTVVPQEQTLTEYLEAKAEAEAKAAEEEAKAEAETTPEAEAETAPEEAGEATTEAETTEETAEVTE